MTEMQARLDRLGINVSDKYNEPADHLAIELDLMGSLIIRAAESTTADQREAWLASRSPCCTATCWAGSSASSRPAGPPTQFGFYGASARLLGFSRWTPTTSPWSNRHRPPTERHEDSPASYRMLAAGPDPAGSGSHSLVTLLFNPDRALCGTAQLTGFAGILLTLYLANLGVEVVLRRRFQIAGMLALLAAWTISSTAAAPRATGWCSTPWRCRFIWWAGWYCSRDPGVWPPERLTSR
jgi:TorA-specific chaperone